MCVKLLSIPILKSVTKRRNLNVQLEAAFAFYSYLKKHCILLLRTTLNLCFILKPRFQVNKIEERLDTMYKNEVLREH